MVNDDFRLCHCFRGKVFLGLPPLFPAPGAPLSNFLGPLGPRAAPMWSPWPRLLTPFWSEWEGLGREAAIKTPSLGGPWGKGGGGGGKRGTLPRKEYVYIYICVYIYI